LSGIGLELRHRVGITHLLAAKGAGSIRIAQLDATRLSSRKGCLGVLGDSAPHSLSHSRDDVDREPVGVRHICGHEVHAAFLEARDEVKVSREPIEARNHEFGPRRFGVADGCLQLRPTIPLAALNLNVFGHEFPSTAIEIPGHRFPLGF
jgi:hypothetical protein